MVDGSEGTDRHRQLGNKKKEPEKRRSTQMRKIATITTALMLMLALSTGAALAA